MNEIISKDTKLKPFLRWAGGKNWLTKSIERYLPTDFQDYHEPFIGGASIFLHLKSNQKISGHSYLSDFNEELIIAYQQVQQNPEKLVLELSKLTNSKDEYYRIRKSSPRTHLSKAVRFIFLNKTSFNGIYRVNLKGEYNVPYGYKDTKNLFEFENILEVSKLFNSDTSFDSCDFFSSIEKIRPTDLVFLDPPYTVAHENNGFIKYNQKIFQWQDQERLAEYIQELNRIGAYYILTNAAHISVEELFSELGEKHQIQRSSNVGGIGATRKKVNEYLFSNI